MAKNFEYFSVFNTFAQHQSYYLIMKKFCYILLSIIMLTSCDFIESIIDYPGPDNVENPDDSSDLDELPLYCDVNEIGGWSNTRFCKNGTTIFTKNYDGTSAVQKTLMFLPTDSLGVVTVYGTYDQSGYPTYLAFDDVSILIDNYTETTFDATVFKAGQPIWTATGLELTGNYVNNDVLTKAWADNNWVRNTVAIGGVITSSIGIGIGVALVGTGVGALAGGASVIFAGLSLADNLNTLFGPAPNTDDSYFVSQTQEICKNTLVDALAKDKDSYLKLVGEKLFKNGSWFDQEYKYPNLFWAELTLGVVDEIWGETMSESQRMAAYADAHRRYQVVTKHSSDITERTAVLWGYVSPGAITPLGQPAEVEYGIVLYEADDSSKRQNKSVTSRDGGSFSILFTDLKPETEYCYSVYYYDKTNGCFRQGEINRFTTLEEELMTLNSISYDEGYYYSQGSVWYELTANITGDTSLIEDMSTCGIYMYDSDLDERYALRTTLSGEYNNSNVKFTLTFRKEEDFKNIDYSNLYAELTGCSFGVYVKYNDGTYFISRDKELKFVYDKKPQISILEMDQGNTVSISEGDWDTQTFYSWKGYLSGTFWMDDYYRYYIGNWREPGKQLWALPDDGEFNYDSWVKYSSENEPYTCYSYLGATANGAEIRSDKQFIYNFNGGSCSISLSAAGTYSTSSLRSIASNGVAVDTPVPLAVTDSCHDKHYARSRVIE